MVGITYTNDGKILENTDEVHEEEEESDESDEDEFDEEEEESDEEPATVHQRGGAQTINASGRSNVKGNTMTGSVTTITIYNHPAEGSTSQRQGRKRKAAGSSGVKKRAKMGEQPRTQTKNGGTNTINASGASNVSGNNVIGQQTNNSNSAPSAAAVHHQFITNNVNQASPARPVYIPFPAAPKRQANTIPGPAPKRAKVKASIPSTSKGSTSKPRESATSTTQRKPKAKPPKNLPHATKKPAAPKASGKKAPKTKNVTKAPKTKAPRKAKKVKVTQKKPPKAKRPYELCFLKDDHLRNRFYMM